MALVVQFLFIAVPTVAQQLQVYSPGDGFLNLRSGPGTQYSVMRELLHGELVTPVERSGNWLRVRSSEGSIGWAYGDFLINPTIRSGRFFPTDVCALVIASRQSTAEVAEIVAAIPDRRNVRVFLSSNNWYAITVGILRPGEADAVIDRWKAEQRIPNDSYCSDGTRYLYELDLKTNSLHPPLAEYVVMPPMQAFDPQQCQSIDVDMEIASCYYEVFGPSLCSAAIDVNGLLEGVLVSTACTAAVNATLSKTLLPDDILWNMGEEAILSACSNSFEADGSGTGVLGQMACVPALVIYLEKLQAADECASRISRVCR